MNTPLNAAKTNPFPGLRPFNEADQHLFFGRESQIDTMVEKLARNHFLAVVGTSGSGKSSLVNCGLKPALRQGMMARAGTLWRIAQFRPGGDPGRALSGALSVPGVLFAGDSNNEAPSLEDVIEATLHMSSLGLVDVYEQSHAETGTNLLVVVDQFEELFRYRTQGSAIGLGVTPDDAVEFVNLLLQAANSAQPIYVVLTMRSDFLGDCARFQGLPEAINKGEYLVPRMTREERRSAIAGPIGVAGAEISPVLLTRLVNDVGDNPDQLSILQHALNRTWVQWQRETGGLGPISLSHYEAIGAMANALDRHAEKAFAELDERQHTICRKLFQALTDKGTDPRGIRRPTRLSTLCAITEASQEEVVAVIDVFRKPSRSFLMPPVPEKLGPETVIDISHESLMRIWTRLITWADEEAVSSAKYVRLAENATLHSKGVAGLLTDPELSLVLDWERKWRPNAAWAAQYKGQFAETMLFLDRSRQERDRLLDERERERRRKLRNTQLVAAALGLLAVIALVSAYTARHEMSRAEANLGVAKAAVDGSLSSAGRQQARESADIPELEAFRNDLLSQAAPLYERLASQNPRSDSLRAETARAHLRLGDINRLSERPTDALQQYNQAVSVFEALVNQHPRNVEYLRSLGYAHNWMGETIRLWWEESSPQDPSKLAEAERQYDLALGYQQQVRDKEPTDTASQQELARSYYNRGIIRYDGKDLQGAESDFRSAISLLEPLAGKSVHTDGQAPDPAQELARAYNDIAKLVETSKPEEAIAQYQHAIDLAEQLSKHQPQNRECKRELAKYYNNQAKLLLGSGKNPALAEQRNHQSTNLLEELITPTPSLSMDLAKSLELRTEIVSARGSNSDSLAESDRLWKVLTQVRGQQGLQGHPELNALYMNLGINYAILAQTSLSGGDRKTATVALERLVQILPEVSTTDRAKLTKAYERLRKQLQAKSTQRNGGAPQ